MSTIMKLADKKNVSINRGLNSNLKEPIKLTNNINNDASYININNNEEEKEDSQSSQESEMEENRVLMKDDSKPTEISGNLSKYFRIEPCRYDQVIYMNGSILLKKFKYDAKKALSGSSRNLSDHLSVSSDQQPPPPEKLEHTLSGSLNASPPTPEKKSSKPTFKVKFQNLKEKKLTYELALNTLKFESVYEKILEETGFYAQHPDYREEDQLVLVIFHDYIKRKFQKRTLPNSELKEKGGTTDSVADEIEAAIYEDRTRLNASLMRTRVRHGVRSLNQLLPETYRLGEEFAEKMLVYMWYNSNSATNVDIMNYLNDQGYKRVSAAKILEPYEFYQDRHCSDVYVFHHDDRDLLQESEIVVKKRMAVVQDKSTSLAIHCFIANIVQGEEIAIVNPTTLLTAVHVEGLLKNKFGSVVPLAPIHVFRAPKEDDDPKILQKMGSTSIKIHNEDILTCDPLNERYRYIRHALFQAKCTRSGVVSPIDFLDTEQDDISLLKDYAMRVHLDGAKPIKISDCIVRNSMILRQCFRFSAVRAVTYLTHSIYEEENEILVHKTVDLINKTLLKDTLEPNGKHDAFVNVPPNLPMLIEDLTENGILLDKNILFQPSAETNGFFISIYCKEHKYLPPEMLEPSADENKPKKKKKKGGAVKGGASGGGGGTGTSGNVSTISGVSSSGTGDNNITTNSSSTSNKTSSTSRLNPSSSSSSSLGHNRRKSKENNTNKSNRKK